MMAAARRRLGCQRDERRPSIHSSPCGANDAHIGLVASRGRAADPQPAGRRGPAEEIRDHLDRRRQQLIADGMEPAAAAIEARRGFGNVTRVREDLRDGWGFPRLESLMQDVRYGMRICAAPGFTAVAVLSLSVGLGAAAVVFNVADAVLFRPLIGAIPGRCAASGPNWE